MKTRRIKFENLEEKLTLNAAIGTLADTALFAEHGSPNAGKVNPGKSGAPTIVIAATATPGIVTGTQTQLSVLAADDGGEANLTYLWSVSTSNGTQIPSFSYNNNNTAKNTTVTFFQAGTYNFTCKITDQNRKSVSSSVQVLVQQTATSDLALSPAACQVAPNATQQFTVTALDQFKNQMSISTSAISWTTDNGTISTGGLYTAPAIVTNATVTATFGSLTAQASVAVDYPHFLGLINKDLADFTQSLNVDGSISRADMIQILRSVGQDDGVVDASEFSDLTTIVANQTVLNMATYVDTLASNVVNGDNLNAYYQGAALGNLASGSSDVQLEKLINKWFLGLDHPTTNYTYQKALGQLYVNGPSYSDTDQGQLGDCWLIAGLASIADANPQSIQNMIIDNGDDTFTIRFYEVTYVNKYIYTQNFITVDRYLPTSGSNLIYDGWGQSINTAELWVPLLEKAFAQIDGNGYNVAYGRNNYLTLEGGWSESVYRQYLGKDYVQTRDEATFQAAVLSNKACSIGTVTSPSYGLVGNHEYAVVAYDAVTMLYTLWNPWGSNQPQKMTFAQLNAQVTDMVYCDAGNSPISQYPTSLETRTNLTDNFFSGLNHEWNSDLDMIYDAA